MSISTPLGDYVNGHQVEHFSVRRSDNSLPSAPVAHGLQITQTLDELSHQFAIRFCRAIPSAFPPSNVTNILSTSPQLFAVPVYYTIINLRPFNEPAYVAHIWFKTFLTRVQGLCCNVCRPHLFIDPCVLHRCMCLDCRSYTIPHFLNS